MLADLPFQPLTELSARLGSGETTSTAILQACITNIDAQEEKLHAFVEIYRDDAMRLAVAADLERQARFVRGPLHGLPIAIKDLFHIEGRQTTAGSKSWRGRISAQTAQSVKRLLDAGMIPLGKTHTVEFAYGTWGTNRPMGTPWNPWDRNVHRVPGGSSSGSAVAVAAGMAPAALGTDTGGSVRIPASLCGLVGLKTTYGRIPLDGVVPLAKSLDSIGPLARTVEDAALLVAAMAGEPLTLPGPVSSLRDVRITALPRETFPDFTEADVVRAYDATIARLRALGASVSEERIPFDLAAIRSNNGRIIAIEGYAEHRAVIDDERADVDFGVRARMLLARNALPSEYAALLAQRRMPATGFAAWMRERDALLTPMLPITARPVAQVDEGTFPLSTWSGAVNYLGGCAISVPAGVSSRGLPIGMQLVGAGGADDRIAAFCRALQIAGGPDVARPPVEA